MNILIIGTTDIIGGAARVSWDIKNGLERRGHHVSMFVADKKSDDPNVKIIPRQKWRKIFSYVFANDDIFKTDWILNTEEFKKADIIHCHNLHGRYFNLKTLQKMSLLKPVVWTLHDEWAITSHCAHSFDNQKMCNGLYKCPNRNYQPKVFWNNDWYMTFRKSYLYNKSRLNIVTPSLWLKNRLEKTVLSKQNIKLIPNGIDTDIFKKYQREEKRKKLNLPLNKKIILILADDPKKNPWKGWKYSEEIIKNYENNENIMFLIIGHHNDELNSNNIINIKHTNDKKSLVEYYSCADMFLVTSIAENLPLTVLEAGACGLPTFAFDVGGMSQIVKNGINGFLREKYNTKALIEDIDKYFYMTDKDRDMMSTNSIEIIHSEFSLKAMLDNYMNLYKTLIK